MNAKALKILGNLLIILVIMVVAPIALLRVMGYQSFCVISGSMEPTISVGSIVCVREADFSELSTGDVIAFYSGNSVVTHRIVSINNEDKLITTKGDANNTNDFNPVAYTNVIGKVTIHFPMYGYVASAVSLLWGKLIAGGILLIGVILSSVNEEKTTDEKPKSKKSSKGLPLLIVGALIIAGAVTGLIHIYGDYHKSNQTYESLNESYVEINTDVATDQKWQDMIDVDFDSLKAINTDVVGWIYVEGTDISYPIMYSGDDESYLRTAIDGSGATAGSIFLEGYNLPDFSDSHNIIYGHNMRNLSMFGTLKYYKSDKDYYEKHKYFQIILPQKKLRFEIFSYFDTETGSWVYTVPYSDSKDFEEYIGKLKSSSYLNAADYDVHSSDQVVTLSTCSSSEKRFTVHGKLVDSQ